MPVVVVESPAKAKTINKYLGKDYLVLASYGHVRDLIPKEGAVETDNGFKMNYTPVERNQKHIASIKKDELWWGLHWGDFSPLLRNSILRRAVYLETIHR